MREILLELDEWAIVRSNVGQEGEQGTCLRHLICQGQAKVSPFDGRCACAGRMCHMCKVEAPAELLGLIMIEEWDR
jgi:hypothetical protein